MRSCPQTRPGICSQTKPGICSQTRQGICSQTRPGICSQTRPGNSLCSLSGLSLQGRAQFLVLLNQSKQDRESLLLPRTVSARQASLTAWSVSPFTGPFCYSCFSVKSCSRSCWGPTSRRVGVPLYESRGGVLIFWNLFLCSCKKLFSNLILKVVFGIKC